MDTKNKPVGIFDSGLGGLTTVKTVLCELPNEDIIYFGDTARVPYGDRSKETIIEYAKDDIEFLLSFDVKAVVIACNTADSMARTEMERIFRVPIIGVVQPSSQRAAALTKNNKIGVIGTNATVSSGAFEKNIKSFNRNAEVFSCACPLLVPLVEEGRTGIDDKVTRRVLREYLEPLKEKGIDTLVLGCTHYPLLTALISDIMPGVTLINSGEAAVSRLTGVLKDGDMLNDGTEKGTVRYFVSDNVESFVRHGSIFMGHELGGKAEQVEIN